MIEAKLHALLGSFLGNNRSFPGAHSARVHQHPGEQGRAENRVLEERGRGAQLQHLQTSVLSFTTPPSASQPGRRSCFMGRVSDVTHWSRHWNC